MFACFISMTLPFFCFVPFYLTYHPGKPFYGRANTLSTLVCPGTTSRFQLTPTSRRMDPLLLGYMGLDLSISRQCRLWSKVREKVPNLMNHWRTMPQPCCASDLSAVCKAKRLILQWSMAAQWEWTWSFRSPSEFHFSNLFSVLPIFTMTSQADFPLKSIRNSHNISNKAISLTFWVLCSDFSSSGEIRGVLSHILEIKRSKLKIWL